MKAERSTQIRWGIVGCGWVARDYVAPGMAAADCARLVALHDTDERAMRRVLEAYERNVFADCRESLDTLTSPDNGTNVRLHKNLEDFLRDAEVDAVYVATPNDLHRPVVEGAARAGKHVLCEKPMATTYADAERMVAACRAAGVRYATAFDQRFHARHRRARALVAAGALGTVTHARIHYACWTGPDWRPPTDDGTHDNWRVCPTRAGGGAFIDLAPHGLDLVQYLLDEPLAEVECLLQRRVFDYPVDDGATVFGRTPSGTLLSMNVAYNCPDAYPRRTLELTGTRAMLLARDTMGQTPGGTLHLTTADGATSEVIVPAEEDVSPFQTQIEVFSRCLLAGEPFPFPPERDLHTMLLIETAQNAARRKMAGANEETRAPEVAAAVWR